MNGNHLLLTATTLLLTGAAPAATPSPAARKALPAVEGVREESFVYKKTPQCELSIHVSFPPGWKASDSRPAIVFFFGGGWTGGSAGGHLAIATAFADGLDAATDDKTVSARPNLLVLYNPVMDTTIYRGKIKTDEMARRLSPMHQITKDLPPAILYYGADDGFYKPVKPLPARAAKLKLDLTVWLAPGQKHGFFNRPPWLQRTTYLTDEFLVRCGYLTGKPTVKLPDGKLEMAKAGKRSG